jgi:hypothetical protein
MRGCGVTRFGSNSVFHFFAGLILAVLLIWGSELPLAAQSTSLRLIGNVWNTSGDPLPGATLTAVEERSGRQYEAVSTKDGDYLFLALEPGIYTVSAKAKGFKDVIHRGICLFMPGTTEENFTFEVSAIEKGIGPRELPRVYDSGTTLSLSRDHLDAVPLLDRDPLPYLVYQPGVQILTGNESASTVNGTRPAMNAIGMDGLSITDSINPRLGLSALPVNPDSIAGIQIITTGAKAEYGRSGGAQVMLASRPGTKTWSGEFYDYFRHKSLDANDFFNNAQKLPHPGLMRNIYGVSLSGPVGNKTRVFGNFEGNWTDQEAIRNRLVLTEEAKTGIFKWFTPGEAQKEENTNSFDIVANDPRGLGIDPSVASTLAGIPDAGNADLGDGLNTGGFLFNNPVKDRRERVSVRLDRNLNQKHQLFIRVNWNHTNATDVLNGADAPFAGEPEGTRVENNWGFVVGSDYALNPQMVNELRVGYLRPKTELERPARSTNAMFLANSWTNPLDPSFPRSYDSPVFEITDNFSHWKNSHVLKYGLTFRRTVLNSVNYSGAYPDVTFGTGMGNAPGSDIGPSEQSEISTEDRQTFEGLYNDLLGRMESVRQTFNSSLTSVSGAGTPRSRSYAFQEYAFYIQDDWRIRPNLMLNLGLRYELGTVPKEQDELQAVLDQAAQVSSTANISNFTVVPGNDWYPRSTTDFAPRAGFVWDMFSTGRTVLRGSYGIYYDRLIGAITNFVDANSYGFSQTVSLYPNAAGTDLRLSDGIPVVAQPSPPVLTLPSTRSASLAIFNPDLQTPRVDQFNVTLEKKLWGAVLEAAYVGTRGRRLFQHLDWNQTKTDGDFLQSFQELKAYRDSGILVPPDNTLVRIFGTPLAAINALGGSNFDTGQAGAAANIMDRTYFDKYAPAGVSDFYLRNFPQFDRFTVGSSVGSSWHDSLQLGLRTSGTLHHLRANYTWSKSQDTLSTDGADFVSPSDNFNAEFNKSLSDFDRTHVFNAAFDYKIPFGKSRNVDSEIPGWIDALLGNWNVAALYIRTSGARFSVSSARETRYGGMISLADFSGSSSIGQIYRLSKGVYWFNPEETELFTYPAEGGSGTSGRNTFTGPSYANLDLSLFKSFPVRERQFIQFRIEAFNVFNQTHFGLPENDISRTNFGEITSTAGNARSLQVALRYQF